MRSGVAPAVMDARIEVDGKGGDCGGDTLPASEDVSVSGVGMEGDEGEAYRRG